jgi:hypothetical protein
MLRLADANCVSLQELLLGFQSRHPDVPCPNALDWGFTRAFLKAMARFSRTPVDTVNSLNLRARLPKADTALLLRFGAAAGRCPRLREKRAGYAFCPTCIAQQSSVHVHWDWAFPALLHCRVHKSPLRHGCPECREEDPLPFGIAPAVLPVLCRNCGANLNGAVAGPYARKDDEAHTFIEKIYRAALRGVPPRDALLGETTATQFKSFVDDLVLLLAWYPSLEMAPRLTDPRNLYLPFRKEILRIIEALVLNAAPASQPDARSTKSQEGLTLWMRVFALLSQRDAEWIENASELWPPALRRRLHSALDHHERSRSLASPFRSTFFRPGFKYINSLEFRELSAVNEVEQQISGI